MKKRDFYLPSSDGKSRLHCVEWLPDEAESQAIKLWVQLVHGMNEHMAVMESLHRSWRNMALP